MLYLISFYIKIPCLKMINPDIITMIWNSQMRETTFFSVDFIPSFFRRAIETCVNPYNFGYNKSNSP